MKRRIERKNNTIIKDAKGHSALSESISILEKLGVCCALLLRADVIVASTKLLSGICISKTLVSTTFRSRGPTCVNEWVSYLEQTAETIARAGGEALANFVFFDIEVVFERLFFANLKLFNLANENNNTVDDDNNLESAMTEAGVKTLVATVDKVEYICKRNLLWKKIKEEPFDKARRYALMLMERFREDNEKIITEVEEGISAEAIDIVKSINIATN